MGCSRSVAADLKWLPEEHWVGLSGHKVKPKLYIAIGISGQVQHIAGIRGFQDYYCDKQRPKRSDLQGM